MGWVVGFFQNKKVLNICFFLFFFLLTFAVLGNGCLSGDDISLNFLEFGISFSRDSWLYGTWVVPLNNFLLYWFPYSLHINLQDWAGIFGAFFQSLVVLSMVICCEKTAKTENLPSYILYPIVLFIYTFSFHFLVCFQTFDFIIFSAFFRFILPSALLVIFLYIFYKYLVCGNVNIFILVFWGIIASSSSEIVAGIALTIVSLSILTKGLEFFLKKNCDKHFLLKLSIVFFALIIGFVMLVSNAGWQEHFSLKIYNSGIAFSNVLANVYDFSFDYWNKIILPYFWLYLVIFILTIVNFLKLKDRKVFTATLFPIFGLISVWIFSYALIILGKTHYGGGYWLDHKDIITVFILVWSYSLAVSLFTFLKNIKCSKSKICICLLVFVSVCFLSYDVYSFYNQKSNLRKFIYLTDKIRLFYEYKDLAPILPPSAKFECVFYASSEKKPISPKDYKVEIIDNGLDKLHLSVYEKYYLSQNYNIQVKNRYDELKILSSIREAMELVEAQGGNFDELNNLYLFFYKLTDKEFVLSKKKN